ncbi:MAG: YegP family protein [Candidatus Bathyarchaeia archaeon]
MEGVFEVYRDKEGEHRFRLKAPNAEIILASEGYSSKAMCLNGIESVKKNAVVLERFEAYEDADGKHRFRLRAANYEIIGVSEAYESEANRQDGIESVKRWAPAAEIKEL